MATSEATRITYRFQVNHGCNAPVCHTYRGMVGRLLPKVFSERRGVLGLDLLDATVEAKVPSSSNRGHSSWEHGLQHRGNSPSLPLTMPRLPRLTSLANGAALGGHLEKR